MCHCNDSRESWKQNQGLHITMRSVLKLSHHLKKMCFVCSAFVSMTVREKSSHQSQKTLFTYKASGAFQRRNPCKSPHDSKGLNKPRGHCGFRDGVPQLPAVPPAPGDEGMGRRPLAKLWLEVTTAICLSARSQPKHLLTPGRQRRRRWPAQGIESCENQQADCAAFLPCLTYQHFLLTTYLLLPQKQIVWGGDVIQTKTQFKTQRRGKHPLNTVTVSDTHLKLLQHWAELVRPQQLTSTYWYLAEAPKHNKKKG